MYMSPPINNTSNSPIAYLIYDNITPLTCKTSQIDILKSYMFIY